MKSKSPFAFLILGAVRFRVPSVVLLGIAAIGCGGADPPAPLAANPYDDRPVRAQELSPAPPAPASRSNPTAAARSAPVTPMRNQTGARSVPKSAVTSARPAPVRDAGATAVQLSLSEYSRLARRASELLAELTEIHIAVEESGDAGPYQDRWGELTADLTKLHREVLQSGYPPAEVAVHLRESWLPRLEEAITNAAATIEDADGVESGFAICHAEAEEIHAHLKQAYEESPAE